MKVTVRAEYACLAMMELASQRAKKKPLRVLDMAKAQGISPQFLVQVLQQLRASGLVESIRGAAGGFCLARSSSKITMADIVDAVDDAARMPRLAFTEGKATKESYWRNSQIERIKWALSPDFGRNFTANNARY